jgi:hypothetical protein
MSEATYCIFKRSGASAWREGRRRLDSPMNWKHWGGHLKRRRGRSRAWRDSVAPRRSCRNPFHLNRGDGRYSSGGGGMRTRRSRRCSRCAGYRAQTSSHRGADASAVLPASDGADHRAGAGPEQAARNGSLARIVRVRRPRYWRLFVRLGSDQPRPRRARISIGTGVRLDRRFRGGRHWRSCREQR